MLGTGAETPRLPTSTDLLKQGNHEPLNKFVGAQFHRAAHHELLEVVGAHLLDVVERDLHSLHIRSDEIPHRVHRSLTVFVDEGLELR